jgi:hypothetical protein
LKKKLLRNGACRVSKEAEFCADFKNVQKSRVWQKGKNFLQKTEFLGTWKILQKIVIFFNSYKGHCCFLEVKSSNKIETIIIFKKTLFYKLVLGFQGQTKTT